MPFSMRQLPDRIEDHSLDNEFTSFLFYLPLDEDYDQAIVKCMKKMKELKKGTFLFGVRALGQYVSLLPGIIG